MKLPCEIIVWYLLPSIRGELAKELSRQGLQQKEIASRLGITQPAVSQYLKDKRGQELKLSKETLTRVRALAAKMIDSVDESMVRTEVCAICDMAKEGNLLCDLHHSLEKVPDDCSVCLKDGDCMLMGGGGEGI
ncbi:MAG: helix-turn-helix domain-containing protein [Candidatus Undinarchaeales archaeon]|jgi:hypothetical protein|nr:helix-turn-helix domain-containing protein [Candidatus Undinarchaeales archaeon]MDP7493494.1 helix-turn-helix domain-containing protein [Candidatus Undinarchaeales archaeon]